MSDEEAHDDERHAEAAIGVGMGGSCPVCRAPVDLGQEFCLECGSPIRFTPRQRRARTGERRPSTQAPPPPPPRSGFPWIPFLVVLALIGSVVAFVVLDDGDRSNGSTSKDTTESGLPEITNSIPQTTSTIETVTVSDCSEAGLDGTSPTEDAASDGFDALAPQGLTDGSALDEQVPSLDTSGSATDGDGSGFDLPSTEAESDAEGDGEDAEATSETITVDEAGQLCDTTQTTTPPVDDPFGTASTSSTSSTESTASTETGATASGDWPAGKQGWTVIVAGYDTRERAAQVAADVQEDGFSDGGVLFSTDFQSLCPGINVVFSGVFDAESAATARQAELKAKGYAGMYVREIRTDGSRPSSCTTVADT